MGCATDALLGLGGGEDESGGPECSGAACVVDDPCAGGGCPECASDADCAGFVDNAAGCYAVACQDGACTAELRHDSPSWHVDPVLTDEIKIADAGFATEALFDGENFLVTVRQDSGTVFGRRISKSGAILDTPGLALDPSFRGIAFAPSCPQAGGAPCYLVITEEQGDHSAEPPVYNWVGGYYLDTAGLALTSKGVVLEGSGGVCQPGTNEDLAGARVAGSGSGFLVTAGLSCGFAVTGHFTQSGARLNYFYGNSHKPRDAVPSARPGGFAVINKENWTGSGNNEAWAWSFDVSGNPTTGYHVVQEYPLGTAQAVVLNWSLIFGNDNFLMAYTRDVWGFGLEILDERLTPTDQIIGPLPFGYQFWTPPELGFDGSNYFAVINEGSNYGGVNLQGLRLTTGGERIDTTALDLTFTDATREILPQLAYDRAGRFLIAYTKESDGGVYVRLFSTCP